MKITKRQLRRIIKEEKAKLLREDEWQPEDSRSEDDKEWEDREYTRGYEDALDYIPMADNATDTYDAGYEDGILDRGDDPHHRVGHPSREIR
jgi:hypothetical protein